MATSSLPVSERIARVIFTRLQKLAAGYAPNTEVSEVIRPTRQGDYTPKNNQIVMTQDNPEVDPSLSHPGNPPATAWRQRFFFHCHVMPSEMDPTSLNELLNYMMADVMLVLTDPNVNWHTFGGLAINSFFETSEVMEHSGGVAGLTIPLVVVYRTDETSLYVMRA